MKFQVIEEHKSNNPKPIMIKKEEIIKIGKRYDVEDGWSNWIYCYSIDGYTEGWTPEQIIKIEGEYGVVLEDYSAKELNVGKGDIVDGYEELNGWIWCSKSYKAEEGWLPKEKIIMI